MRLHRRALQRHEGDDEGVHAHPREPVGHFDEARVRIAETCNQVRAHIAPAEYFDRRGERIEIEGKGHLVFARHYARTHLGLDRFEVQPQSVGARGVQAIEPREVVGVVRIYEPSPGVWYGGRLGVDVSCRSTSHVGRSLVVKAVTTAHAWGCREFWAIVQTPNVPFFQRLHWHAVEKLEAHGTPHTKMKADLDHYPPSEDADIAWRPKASSYDAA